MSQRIQKCFLYSVAVILFITGAVKLLAAFGSGSILNQLDPVLMLANWQVLAFAGGLEILISAYLLAGRNDSPKLVIAAWLATVFLTYRAGLWWSGAADVCNCVGYFPEQLALSPRMLNRIMLAILVLLFAGSYGFLILDWVHDRKLASWLSAGPETTHNAPEGGS